jgi:hypothetical protein
MKQYRVKSEYIEIMKRRMWIGVLLIIALGFIIDLLTKYFNYEPLQFHQILIVSIFASISYYFKSRKKIEISESLIITISENSILREQKRSPSLEIAFKDLNEINRQKNGDLIVKGKTSDDIILIPFHIENLISLENSLYKIRPISNDSDPSSSLMFFLTTLLIVVSIFLLFTVKNKIIDVTAGIIITSLLIWQSYRMRKRRFPDDRIRRYRLIGMLFTLLVILAVLLKIFNKTNCPF